MDPYRQAVNRPGGQCCHPQVVVVVVVVVGILVQHQQLGLVNQKDRHL
jgi:hypothetical protein